MRFFDISNKFSIRFFLDCVILLGANAWFLYAHHNVPDGRILFMLPITSIFILFFVLCLHGIGKFFFGKTHLYLTTAFVAILSVIFILFGNALQMAFPDTLLLPTSVFISVPRIAVFPFLSYAGIFGGGIIACLLMALLLKKLPYSLPC
jgi:hypothetical protein